MSESADPLSGDQARTRLYEVMRTDGPIEDRIESVLEIGTEYFGVEHGFVATADEATDEWKVIVSTDATGDVVPEGFERDFSTTVCHRTIREDGVLALADIDDGSWAAGPPDVNGIKCYHGAPLVVDGETWGTVCFVSTSVRKTPFSVAEKSFTDTVAGMIGHEIERRDREAELDARERELKERQEIYRATIDASFDMIFRIDTAGEYTYHSAGSEQLLGYTPEELIGKPFTLLLPDEQTVALGEALFERVLAGETIDERYLPLERADGSIVYVDIRVTPIYDAHVPEADRSPDDIVAVQGVTHDATDRKRRERLVRVLNRVLRHNLRNDMTVVGGLAETLETRLDDAERDIAARIGRASDRLLELAEMARTLEENIDDSPTIEPVDVVPMVETASAGADERYPDATITVDTPENAVALGAPRLETALWELVDNAAQHGGEEPTVRISVTVEADSVRIVVADDGPGLPEGERAVLTSGEETPLIHGSGLGLWLVHWIVTGLGGEILVSDVDTGAQIEIALPCAGPE